MHDLIAISQHHLKKCETMPFQTAATAAMITRENEIEDIVTGMSETARVHLISMLGELFNTLANLDAICPTPCPPCHAYMKFERLNKLLATLLEQNADRQD